MNDDYDEHDEYLVLPFYALFAVLIYFLVSTDGDVVAAIAQPPGSQPALAAASIEGQTGDYVKRSQFCSGVVHVPDTALQSKGDFTPTGDTQEL